MSVTRRELDARLRDIENALLFISTKVPALVQDVRALREELAVPPEEPAPEPEPVQEGLGLENT